MAAAMLGPPPPPPPPPTIGSAGKASRRVLVDIYYTILQFKKITMALPPQTDASRVRVRVKHR
jgi:hypothetical protein